MSFRDRYEFDPNAYSETGLGGLLSRMRAMLADKQAGADIASTSESDRPGAFPSFAGEPADLVDRLSWLQRAQSGYVPEAPRTRNNMVDRIIGAESSGDPNAANHKSTARGLGQFTRDTWLDMLARYRPDLTGTPEALLALRYDPVLSRQMVEALVAENTKSLTKAGHQASPGNIYLAHFAGPAGAVAVLDADPDTPVPSVLTPRTIAANPFLEKMTVAGLKAWADRKVSKNVGRPPSSPAFPAFPERASPIFPRQAAPVPVSGTAGTPLNDGSWALDPRPISSLRAIDFANSREDNRTPRSVGLVSGEPIQHWMMPIFDTDR